MGEIELSNRFYYENDVLFMTANLLSNVKTGIPVTHPVTFILAQDRLITVRYVDTTSLRRFSIRAKKEALPASGRMYLLMLLGTIVNREADILEWLDRDIDAITKQVFQLNPEQDSERTDYKKLLTHIGRCGDLASKAHDSLTSLSRAVAFLTHHLRQCEGDVLTELTSLQADTSGLSDHGTYLTNKVNFLLDATLGMISIEQNSVFRVLSIASLIFMPPTLVAGIYGMNFKFMPELDWHYGYPLATLLMIIAAIAPYAVLKRKKLL